MASEYRESNPPEEEIIECTHCGFEHIAEDGYKAGYCSKNCYHYDNE